MKKKPLLIIAIVLAIVALFYIFNEGDLVKFRKNKDRDFAVDDTSSITKVFLSDKQNRSILLTRITPGNWTLNDSLPVRNDGINTLLKTIKRLEVKEFVTKAGQENVMKRLATIGVKVEIYQTVYRIDIFGLQLFPHEKCVKTYYVGDQTQNMMGTYMIMDDGEQPYIMHIPGFNGFLSSRFSTLLNDWRDHTIFGIEFANIKSVELEFPSEEEESFKVENQGNGNYSLESTKDNVLIADFDTIKLLDFLAAFRDVKYEAMITDDSLHNKDSVIASTPFHNLKITDMSGKVYMLSTFHKKPNEGEMELDGTPTLYDKDRLYALFNDRKDFALIQFYVFDNILRPLSYFLKEAPAEAQK